MDNINAFIDLLKNSCQTTVLTGAGISTLSGIKDFRSSNGIYSKKFKHLNVEDILDYNFFLTNPEIFYSWAKENWYGLDQYNPNIVHSTLAKLEDLNLINEIFTQNVDMLHAKANSKKVYEVHGNVREHICTNCKKLYSYEEIFPLVKEGKVPKCNKCNGLIKPNIIFYGENLDVSLLEHAYQSFSNSDLAIVLGSSLVVQPVASFPMYTLNRGGKLVIINKESTPFDNYATLKFDDLEKTFIEINKFL